MRWLYRLVVVLIVFLIVIPLLTPPAGADDVEAYITLSPDDGVPGEEVTVRGYNFSANKWVDIYYDGTWQEDVKTDKDGYFKVTFKVPESYTGDYEVFAEDEDDIIAYADFNAEPGLTVSPEKGPVDTTVTVEGHGFAEDEEDIELRYYPDSVDYEAIVQNIEADEDGWWQYSFPIPPSPKGNHYIKAKGEESTLSHVQYATFEVTPKISIIDESSGSVIDEPSGSMGDNIMLTGSGFEANERDIKIFFAGEEVETEIIRADDTGYWQESFEVPEMSKGTYSVTAAGEWTQDISELIFKVEPGLVLSPNKGHVGINLTVAGRGFATNKNVVIKYDGNEVETATTNDEGSFDVSFLVPESKHGKRQVTAEDAAENEAAAIFTMESKAPDTPELTSPPDGDRVGFIGRVRPTFEWSEVPDDSGVYYHLQIATSDEVTANGEFVEPMILITDLTETSYTLEEAHALSYDTYYWSVQAVDRAENESGWSTAYSFRVGLLPLWAFIVIIVVIVVLIGTLVYFFVIRKRVHYY